MSNLLQNAQRLMRDEEGATAIEYALLASLIAVAIAVAVASVGTNLDTLFNNVVAAF